MASYAPLITIEAQPGISAQMPGGLTYDEFLASLGQYVYWIKKYYLSANSIAQLIQPFQYYRNDSTGEAEQEVIVNNPDPYQSNTSMVMDVTGRSIVLDGNSSISFDLMTGEQMIISLFTTQESMIGPPSNFALAEDDLDQLDLYKNYLSQL